LQNQLLTSLFCIAKHKNGGAYRQHYFIFYVTNSGGLLVEGKLMQFNSSDSASYSCEFNDTAVQSYSYSTKNVQLVLIYKTSCKFFFILGQYMFSVPQRLLRLVH
jgi:hypothetical protein